MTTFAKSWFKDLVYFITPENSLVALHNKGTTKFYPPSNPLWVGTLKTVFWIVISIGFSLLISRHL